MASCDIRMDSSSGKSTRSLLAICSGLHEAAHRRSCRRPRRRPTQRTFGPGTAAPSGAAIRPPRRSCTYCLSSPFAARCYLDGSDMAVVLLCLAFIEREMAATLYAAGWEGAKKARLATVLEKAYEDGVVSELEWRTYQELARLRNSHAHFRAPGSEPGARHHRADVLPVEAGVRRDEGEPRTAPEGARARKRAPEASSVKSATALASLKSSTTDLVNDSASSPPRIVMNSTQQPSPCCTSKLIPSSLVLLVKL